MGKKSKRKSHSKRRQTGRAPAQNSDRSHDDHSMDTFNSLLRSSGWDDIPEEYATFTTTDNNSSLKAILHVQGDFGARDVAMMGPMEQNEPDLFQSILGGVFSSDRFEFQGPSGWTRPGTYSYLKSLGELLVGDGGTTAAASEDYQSTQAHPTSASAVDGDLEENSVPEFFVDGDLGEDDFAMMEALREQAPDDFAALLLDEVQTLQSSFDCPPMWSDEKAYAYLQTLAVAVEKKRRGEWMKNRGHDDASPQSSSSEEEEVDHYLGTRVSTGDAKAPRSIIIQGDFGAQDMEALRWVQENVPSDYHSIMHGGHVETAFVGPSGWSKEELCAYVTDVASAVEISPEAGSSISTNIEGASTLPRSVPIRGDFGDFDIEMMKKVRKERPLAFLSLLQLQSPDIQWSIPNAWSDVEAKHYIYTLANKVQEGHSPSPARQATNVSEEPNTARQEHQENGFLFRWDYGAGDLEAMQRLGKSQPFIFSKLLKTPPPLDCLDSLFADLDGIDKKEAVFYLSKLAKRVEKEHLPYIDLQGGFCDGDVTQMRNLRQNFPVLFYSFMTGEHDTQHFGPGSASDKNTDDYVRLLAENVEKEAIAAGEGFLSGVSMVSDSSQEENDLQPQEVQVDHDELPPEEITSHAEFFVSPKQGSCTTERQLEGDNLSTYKLQCTSCNKSSRKMVQLYCGHWYCRTCILTTLDTPYCLECGFDLCLDIYFPVTKKPKRKDVCFWCYRQGPKSSMKVCSGCQVTGDKTTYCSDNCQEEAWLTHKRTAHAHWEGKVG